MNSAWNDGFALGLKIGETKAAINGLKGKQVTVKLSRDRVVEHLAWCEEHGYDTLAAKIRQVYPELHWAADLP